MDKTYSEKMGIGPFDWNKALDAASSGELNCLEIGRLISRAGHWVACACGNMCAIIPRCADGTPEDPQLYHLGMRFYYSIEDLDWVNAKVTLKEIETRSAVLIQDELRNLNTTLVAPCESKASLAASEADMQHGAPAP